MMLSDDAYISISKHVSSCTSVTVLWTDQIVQRPHQRFELMLSQPALVHGAKGGSGPAHGAGGDGPVNAAVQQDQVLFSSSAAQCCHLQEQQSNASSAHLISKDLIDLFSIMYLKRSVFSSCT